MNLSRAGSTLRRSATRPRSVSSFTPRRLAVILAVAGLALIAASAAWGQPERASAQAKWILFTARPPGLAPEQIFRISQSGTGLKQLTHGTYAANAPAISPDGKRFAFTQLGAGLFTANLDGTGVRQLSKNGRDGFPAWSPDGKQIVFVRPAAKGWGVFVISPSGSGEHQLPEAPSAGRPSWTSQGLLIPTEGDLARIDTKTGKVLKLYGAIIDASVGMNGTAISPDLSTITFEGSRPPIPGDKDCGEGIPCAKYALYIQDLRTLKDPKVVAVDAGPAAFSPDGKSLAFIANDQLVLKPLDKGPSTILKIGKVYPSHSTPPAWQPR
jgi:Tol biopolymer transport system component